MESQSAKNTYLDQVQEKQQKLEVDLKARKRSAFAYGAGQAAPAARKDDSGRFQRDGAGGGPAEERGNAVEVKITGLWRWKTVLVPPNAYVVHKRRGRDQPLHEGLGVSFRFDPMTDTFLVVPGAMQTILISAYCICKELQGLLVQGYVQWIIQDFPTAYKKLDFSDAEDPMRLVNVQLREQAEAAIKDKVATMGIDEVLSDKQPIIEELTQRLRHVAEGAGGTDKGLGLRIVTVQIKEAVVSSTRVWENLQKPFRSERARVARLAELEAETVIQAKELASQRARETAELESQSKIDALRQDAARKSATEQHATTLAGLSLEKERQAKDAEVARARIAEAIAQEKTANDAKIALEDANRAARNRQTEKEIAFLDARQKVENVLSDENVRARVVAMLPQLAEKLPKPAELRSISIGNGPSESASLASLIAQVMTVVDSFKDGKDAKASRAKS